MPINLNMGNVVSGVLPENEYLVHIEDAVFKEAKSQDKFPTIWITYSVDEPFEYSGRTFMDFLSLSPAALWKIQSMLEAATGEEWRDDDMELDLEDLPGTRLRIAVIIDEYNGKKNNKARDYFPAVKDGAGSSFSLDNDEPF